MPKKEFIRDEVWLLSTFGAFQRANAYKPEVSEIQKTDFRIALRKYLDQQILEKYCNEISESEHIENILAFANFTSKFGNILQDEKLNFGISQKLFNLYLKYLWCLGEIPTPPHFPVDRIIQIRLGIKEKDILPWTKFKTETPYLEVINKAKEILKDSDFESLAHLELVYFKR